MSDKQSPIQAAVDAKNKAANKDGEPKNDPPKATAKSGDEAAQEQLFREFLEWKKRFGGEQPQGNGMTEQQVSRIVHAVSQGKTTSNGMLNSEFSDPADVIEQVVFFAPYSYFNIYHKKAGQFTEGLPNGLRVLTFVRNPAKSKVKGNIRQHICELKVTSHTLLKWLTGKDINGKVVGQPHEDFRVKFYMDKDKLPADNFAVWEQIFATQMRSLEAMSHANLLKLAEAEWRIEPNSSLDKKQVAVMIAKKRADQQYEQRVVNVERNNLSSAKLAQAAFGGAAIPA